MNSERTYRQILPGAMLLLVLLLLPRQAAALTVWEVAKDLACPCECPLILQDCNMTCGLEWKDEVGQMIADGKTKQEIVAYFIETYGEEARLTTVQKIEGKIYQYTRGFGAREWTLLWTGIGIWVVAVFAGIYLGVRNLSFRARRRGAPAQDPHTG